MSQEQTISRRRCLLITAGSIIAGLQCRPLLAFGTDNPVARKLLESALEKVLAGHDSKETGFHSKSSEKDTKWATFRDPGKTKGSELFTADAVDRPISTGLSGRLLIPSLLGNWKRRGVRWPCRIDLFAISNRPRTSAPTAAILQDLGLWKQFANAFEILRRNE